MNATKTRKTTQQNSLDRLVNTCTAFRSWAEMCEVMGGKGDEQKYVPTMNGSKSYAKLAGILTRNGYRVFRGGRVI